MAGQLSEEPIVVQFGRAEASVLLEWWYAVFGPDHPLPDDHAFQIALQHLHNVLDEAVEAEQIANLWAEARARVLANDPFRPGGPRNPQAMGPAD